MEEEARREAMQRAAVEQARNHRRGPHTRQENPIASAGTSELQRMRAETVRKPGPGGYIASALGGAAGCLTIALVLHFAVSKPAADLRIAETRSRGGRRRRPRERVEPRVEEQNARIKKLEDGLREKDEELTEGSCRPGRQAGRGGDAHARARRRWAGEGQRRARTTGLPARTSSTRSAATSMRTDRSR